MSRLVVSPHRCIGCRTCEMSCAFAHATRAEPPASFQGNSAANGPGGVPGRPRLKISLSTPGRFVPLLCMQCEDARCVDACSYGALQRSGNGLWVDLDSRRCTRCQLCTVACPFGNIELDALREQVIKCDLCQGNPACARFCPTGALSWTA